MAGNQTQSEWEEEMAVRVLALVRTELYRELRFLNTAFSAFEWSAVAGTADEAMMATDGCRLYYTAGHLLRVFEKNPLFLDRCYLHMTLHCVFSHLWLRKGRNEHWNLACDIAVERIIDYMGRECTKRPVSWLRKKTYDELAEKKIMSAAGVYTWLQGIPEEHRQKLTREFYTDSHRYWKDGEKESPRNSQTRDMWNRISRQSRMEIERRGDEKQEGAELLEQEIRAQRSRRSYREFLRKFAVLREEIHCDPDEFDMNYYTYGLGLYGNMPLIEPLESREVMKIQEFVVAVDTSYSTNGELIKNFLRETFRILTEFDSFFRKCHIRIIQCDDKVTMDEKITEWDELEKLVGRFTLAGGGGTDFRPVFSYVDELMHAGELKNLRGLLYFTDGKGIYPAKRPDYDTAFLFMDEYDESAVPPWAMRLRLQPEEFRNGEKSEK